MRWYFIVILSAVVSSLAGLSIIVLKFDPFQASGLIKFLFLGTLFVAVWGAGTFAFLGFKKGFSGAFRRGFLLGAILISAIVFNRLRLLNILNFSILLGVVVALEWFLTKTLGHKDKESWT